MQNIFITAVSIMEEKDSIYQRAKDQILAIARLIDKALLEHQ